MGGRQIGIDAGDAGSEPEASPLVVLVMDAGVVVPDADDGSVESLLRLDDDPKLLTLDVSWLCWDSSAIIGVSGDDGM